MNGSTNIKADANAPAFLLAHVALGAWHCCGGFFVVAAFLLWRLSVVSVEADLQSASELSWISNPPQRQTSTASTFGKQSNPA